MPPVLHRLAVRGAPVWQPAGPRLAVLADNALALVNPHAPAQITTFAEHAALRSFAWSPAGDRLALASEGRQHLAVARAVDGAALWHIDPGDEPDALLWSPDELHLFAMGCPSVLCDAATGAIRWTHERAPLRTHASFDPLTARESARFASERLWPTAAAWSPDSRHLALTWTDLFRVLDLTGRVVHEEPTAPARGRGEALQWGDAGAPMFVAGATRLGRCTLDTADGFARSFTFSGRLAAAEGAEHVLHVRDEHGEQVRLPGHPRTITALAWSPQGTLATACRDGMLRRLTDPRGPIEAWHDLGARAEQLAWSADGTWLAATTPHATWLIAT